jgi:energy-coupling factor transport system ATP-binding protein
VIELIDVGFTYGGAETPALAAVSLTVRPGETVALLGPNGSGKSTLARLANALMLPDTGQVLVDGMDTRDPSFVWTIRSRVGYVQQNPDNQIVGGVVEEDVAFGPENLGVDPPEIRRRVDAALAAVGLTGLERREPHLLSEGQKQRLAIAGALALEPAYLVLDEPTAMLDAEGRADVLRVLDALRERGVGMLHITHSLADVANADRLVVLNDGRVVFEGAPQDLLADPGLARSFGLEVPPIAVVAAELRSAGVPVHAGALDAEALVEALWR